MVTRSGGRLYPAAGPNGDRRCGLLSVAVPARPLPDDMQHLLSELGWLRRLAIRLGRDESDADDAVQETWLAALRVPPDADRPARPWLMSVLRHVFHRRSRTERRRQAREDAAHALASRAHESAGEAWERLELHRLIAELVSSLDEPYRSTIVWRFFEGLSAVQVARQAGVPEGTVRWRTSEGLRRLRALLDQRFGLAARWRPLVLGVSGGSSVEATASAETTALWKGALSMKLGRSPPIGILLLVMLAGTAALMLSRGAREEWIPCSTPGPRSGLCPIIVPFPRRAAQRRRLRKRNPYFLLDLQCRRKTATIREANRRLPRRPFTRDRPRPSPLTVDTISRRTNSTLLLETASYVPISRAYAP